MTSLGEMSTALSIRSILDGGIGLNYWVILQTLTNRAREIVSVTIALSLLIEYMNEVLNGDTSFVDMLDLLRTAIVSTLVGSTEATNHVVLGQYSIKDAIDHLNDNDKNHILKSEHDWNKLVPEPNDPNNWNKIAAIIATVLARGTEEPHRSAFKKVLEIGGHVVEVTYQYVNGILRISDAWIKKTP